MWGNTSTGTSTGTSSGAPIAGLEGDPKTDGEKMQAKHYGQDCGLEVQGAWCIVDLAEAVNLWIVPYLLAKHLIMKLKAVCFLLFLYASSF